MTHYKRIIQLEFNEITSSSAMVKVIRVNYLILKKRLCTWNYRATTSEN